MKAAAQMLAAVREAMKYALMENAELGSIHRNQPGICNEPVRNEAGELVTEANVTEFIRERTRLHHHAWVLGPLEGVAQQLQSELLHTFKEAPGIYHYSCVFCGCPQSHRSHRK